MATSGIYVTTLTVTQLVTDALVDLGILDAEESPSANQLSTGIRKLNHVLYQLKGPASVVVPGTKPWTREVVSLTPATKASYSLKPSGGDANAQVPTEILAVLLRHTATSTDTSLHPMTSDEYLAVGNKAATGTPTKYYYEKRIDQGLLYFNCVPDAATIAGYTFQITYRQPLEIVTAGSQTMDLPDWWNRAMEWMLAREMGVGFTVDDRTWQRVVALANESVAVASSHDLENPVAYFEPGKDVDN